MPDNTNVNIKDIFVNEEDENDSEMIEFDQDSYKCKFCPENNPAMFDSDELRIKHVNEVHVPTNESQLQCPKCLQFFKTNPLSENIKQTTIKIKFETTPAIYVMKAFQIMES